MKKMKLLPKKYRFGKQVWLTVFWLICCTGLGLFLSRDVRAGVSTMTSRADFEMGVTDGTEYDSRYGELKVKSGGSWGPQTWSSPNRGLTVGTGLASDSDYMYLMVGRDNILMRFVSSESRWENLASPEHMPGYGGDLIYLDGYLYAIFGEFQKNFARYSIASDSWEDLIDLPDLVYGGGSIETDGTDIYILRGYNSTEFWKYNVVEESFEILSSTPASIYHGADLTYDNGYLYTPRGYNRTDFYRYDISANSWSSMANSLVAFYDVHNMDVKDGYIYTMRDRGTNTFYRYSISGNSWTELTTTPIATRYVGLVHSHGDDQLYVFRGNGGYEMWKYDETSDEFIGPANAPSTFSSGADLVYQNGYLYAPRGANQTTFYRYELSSNSWETRTSAPDRFNDDMKGVSVGTNLYFMRGSNTRDFWIYSTTGNSWSVGATLPNTARYGGAMAYPGSGDYIYATRGNYTRHFWRYSISGDSWDDSSVADIPDGAEAAYGARLIADESDSNVLYYISGSRTSEIYKYEISEDVWTDIGNLPYGPYWGTDAVYYDEKLYIQEGYYSTVFWEFDLASGPNQYSWRKLSNLSSYYAYDRGPYNGGALEKDASGNLYSIWGSGLAMMQVFDVSSYDYESSGTWLSGTKDLTFVGGGTTMSLSVGSSTPGDSSVSVETRTSADEESWTDWQGLSGDVVQSTTNRYIQIKLTLTATTDRSQTPTVYGVVVNYEGDSGEPTNPDSVEAYSKQVGGVALSVGETYNYLNPYFNWDGASDNGTGVAGYYVYFGVNETADPEFSGNYQTNSSFLVTENLETGTYFLRVKTVDVAGNISLSVADLFTYAYRGLGVETLFIDETSEFLGVGESVSVSGDEVKLANKPGYWKDGGLMYTPANIYYGGDLAYSASDRKMFALRGYNSRSFYIYDMDLNSWSVGATTPNTVYYGGSLTEGPEGYLYAFSGYNRSDFWRYSIDDDEWEVVANAPQQVYQGASLTYDGENYIYALKGNNDDAFWRYDTGGDVWELLSSVDFGAPSDTVNNLVRYGGDLSFDGNDTVFAIQGNLRSGFAAYSITTDSWETLPNLPSLSYGGAEIAYDSVTDSVYFIPGYNSNFFFRYDVSEQTWTRLDDMPRESYYGCSMRAIDGDLYVLRGDNSNLFYKYDISESSWLVPSVGLFGKSYRGNRTFSIGYGGNMTAGDNGDFYVFQGNYSSNFIKWNEDSGEVTDLTNIPASLYVGSAAVFDGVNNKLYAIGSHLDRRFMVYDVATDTWSEDVGDSLPTDPSNGSSLSFDGSRYVYWLRGTSTYFYRYDTQGTVGNKWEQLTNTPGSSSYGSEIVYKDGSVYMLRGVGANPNPLYRYDVGTTSWDTSLESAPMRVYNTGFLVDGGGDYLYACRAENQSTCYRYSISGDSWSEIEGPTTRIYYGAAAASNGTNQIHAIFGPGTGSYADGLYTYVMQTNNSSFVSEGSYVSQSHDLGVVYKYANISLDYESATNSSLIVSTRSSSDDSEWTSWTTVSREKRNGREYKYKINSIPQRYIQVKFEFISGDGVSSGKVHSYSVNYFQDIDDPTNFTNLVAYDSVGMGETFVSGVWKNSTAPYFDWPDAEESGGSSDTLTGSGVAGYYVYFGVGETADPEVLGTGTTASNYTADDLDSGETYYLRIKTYDNAGNVSSGVGTTFVYRLDTVNPTNPQTVTSDPPGYTSVNNYTIAWDGSEDDGSGVSEYCYKTSEENFVEVCTSDVGVTGLEAYKMGTNTFYVRAKDTAGNMPSEYSTTSYYYNSIAPPPPQNLVVTPTENSVNEFAFSWSPPSSYYGSQAGLRYYYSINALPTPNNVNAVGLVNTYLPVGPYATQLGDNYFYLLVKDEAGNIDYNLYETIIFSANTTAPGKPSGVEIGDISVKSTESWRLALSWDAPEATGSGVANYRVYRSTETDADCINDFSDFSLLSTTSVPSYVDTSLDQLDYYYCIKACDSTNNCGVVSDTVTSFPDGKWLVAPAMVASPSATVRTKSSTVTWSTSRTCSSFVKYGTASGEYGEEVGSSDHLSLHEVDMEGLDPGTTYYYQALWTDEDGNTGSSDEFTFTTKAAPIVSTVEISDVGLFSVYVNFTMANATKATIQYGNTVNYGSMMAISTSTTESEYSVKLDELDEGSVYHMRIVAEDEESNYFYSDDYTFETLPVPKLSDVRMQQVRGMPTSTVRVVWKSNTDISSVVTYYPEGRPEMTKDKVVITLSKKHEIVVDNLTDDTAYVMVLKGKDAVGNWAESVNRQVKTAIDLRAPLVSNLKTEVSVVGVGDVAKAKIVVTWDTDELSTSQVEYGQGTGGDYSSKTQEDNRMSSNHLVMITDLKPSEVYHLRVVSNDKMNNRTESYDNVVVTPKATKSALDLVISNLSKSFGFVSNLSKNVNE